MLLCNKKKNFFLEKFHNKIKNIIIFKITANLNSYTAGCSLTCSASASTATAYCNSNNCNTISLVNGITIATSKTDF